MQNPNIELIQKIIELGGKTENIKPEDVILAYAKILSLPDSILQTLFSSEELDRLQGVKAFFEKENIDIHLLEKYLSLFIPYADCMEITPFINGCLNSYYNLLDGKEDSLLPEDYLYHAYTYSSLPVKDIFKRGNSEQLIKQEYKKCLNSRPANTNTETTSDETDEHQKTNNTDHLNKIIHKTLTDLDPYCLSRRASSIIKEFITFKTQRDKDKSYAVIHSFYNLIIRSDDCKRAEEMVKIILQNLNIDDESVLYVKEKDFINNSLVLDNKQEVYVIMELQKAPTIDMEAPSGTLKETSIRNAENYRRAWKDLTQDASTNTQKTYIIIANDDAFDSLKNNTELFYRVCGHHIFLNPLTEDQLFHLCIGQLKQSKFEFSEKFEQELSDYFHIVYKRAELQGTYFVEDLVRRIFSLFYCKPRKKYELTTDCIPLYHNRVRSPQDVLSDLNHIIGLQNVKNTFLDMYRSLIATKQKNQRYHMLFMGNPGTGKSTIAKLSADLFCTMNIIRNRNIVTCRPNDFVSGWVGNTGNKTKALVESAYGGVLFIDEAYGFNDLGEYGRQALNVLVQEMEDNRDKLIVIMAGYQKELEDLLELNKGLSSRIWKKVYFRDYTIEELLEIFQNLCDREGFTVSDNVMPLIEEIIVARKTSPFFGNAREVENIFSEIKEAWSEDYYKTLNENPEADFIYPKELLSRHCERIMPPKDDLKIEDMVGLDQIKEKLEELKSLVQYQKYIKARGVRNFPGFSQHMVFTGNPGTGKTTVAKLLANDLYSVGILKTNKLIVAERIDLVDSVIGGTAVKTNAVIQKAVGGVLFVDEAYSLASGGPQDFGREAIETLLTAMEEHKEDTIFIFAGYVNEMQDFLSMNPGLQSRIGFTFHFPDYKPEELQEIFRKKIEEIGFTITESALEKVKSVMEYFCVLPNFGNGRFINHVIQQTCALRAQRDYTENYRDIRDSDIPEVKQIIDTAPKGMMLYDPKEISPESVKRTAIHELGHAVMLYLTQPDFTPKAISLKKDALSLGRVELADSIYSGSRTEQDLRNNIAVLLSGRNAERLFFGDSATGCAQDYETAKRIATNMVEKYAMGDLGITTPMDILQEEDKRSMDLITKMKTKIEVLCDKLMEKRELSGEYLELFIVGQTE